MYIPMKSRVALAVVAGFGICVGLFIYGCMVHAAPKIGYETVQYASFGGGALASGTVGLVMYFLGAFSDIRDDNGE